MQPDTIVPDYKNPQALNRYSYVLNNPLRYTDPTGNEPEEPGDYGEGGEGGGGNGDAGGDLSGTDAGVGREQNPGLAGSQGAGGEGDSGWTAGLGLFGSAGVFGAGGQAQVLFVVDGAGEWGIAVSAGGGAFAGFGGSVGVTLEGTNASTIDKLNGLSVQTGADMAAGEVSVGAEWITNNEGLQGADVNVGLGQWNPLPGLPGGDFHSFVMETKVLRYDPNSILWAILTPPALRGLMR